LNKNILISFLLLLSLNLFALEKNRTQADVESLIQQVTDQFHVSQLLNSTSKSFSGERRCREPLDSCEKVVCDTLPSYLCDDVSDIRGVAQVCSVVRDSGCISEVIKKLPSYLHDDLSDMKDISKVCTDIPRTAISLTCSHFASYLCDDISDLEAIAKLFRGKRRQMVKCVKFACGKLPSYLCDDVSDIKQVVASCEGN
jgi:hypothetical protein